MKKQFLVALHVQNREQVLTEAKKILFPQGAHGVILVNNGLLVLSKDTYPNMFDIAIELKEKFPNYLVGVNPLDLSVEEAIEAIVVSQIEHKKIRPDARPLDILWTDNSGIQEDTQGAFLPAKLKQSLRELQSDFGVKYYGSIAFKYLPQPGNLKNVSLVASRYFSSVITSGSATGNAPEVQKVQNIKGFIGGKSLGIASGLKKENIKLYAPYADIFIVGTSLLVDPSNDFVYDQKKIEDFRTEFDSL